MGSEVLAYRKFLNERQDGYISVRTDKDSVLALGKTWTWITMCLSDGYRKVEFEYCMDKDSDKVYEEAMEELEKIRIGIITTMDELVEAYSKHKYNSLEYDPDSEQSERIEDAES